MPETRESLEVKLKDIIGSSVQECYALYEAVLGTAHLNGAIVEIGCLYGRTSIPICLAAKEIGAKSTHIDYLFQYPDLETCRLGGYDKYPSPANIDSAMLKSTHLQIFGNFIKNDLFDDAIFIASKSEQAREIWEKEIRFLFIDADHSYEGVKKDYELFAPFLVSGGILALHDVDEVGHPGVVRFFNELMSTNKFQIVYNGGGTSLRILRSK